jgi:hypothetical protein
LWRDERRKQLRAEGVARTEATEMVWQELTKEFPPLPESEVQSPGKGYDIQLLDIDPNSYDGQSGCMGDVAWVYQNLSVKSAAPHQAPSSGAWGLLQWARRNSDKFFPLWAKTMPGQAVQDTELWRMKEEPRIGKIEQMIACMKNGGYKNGDIDFSAPNVISPSG